MAIRSMLRSTLAIREPELQLGLRVEILASTASMLFLDARKQLGGVIENLFFNGETVLEIAQLFTVLSVLGKL